MLFETVLAFLAPLGFAPSPVEKTKAAKPRSIDHFIAWMETKNPNTEYNPWCPVSCLMAQYRGSLFKIRFTPPLLEHVLKQGEVPYRFIAMPTNGPWTFGAAIERAKAWRANHGGD